MYLVDVHTHTSEVSSCGVYTAAESVEHYAALGYNAIFVTDHFKREFLQRKSGTYEERVEAFMSGYRLALEAGKRRGLDVYFGAEVKLEGSDNEYLVYGIDEGFLLSNEDLCGLTVPALSERVHAAGAAIFQAHPFRPRMTMADPKLLDGIEVCNGNPRHNSSNLHAISVALEDGLLMLSGSDSHEGTDPGMGGMAFLRPFSNASEMLEMIRAGAYRLIVAPEKLGR